MSSEAQSYAVHDVDGTLWSGALFTNVMNMAVAAELTEPAGTWIGEDPTRIYLQNLPQRIAGRDATIFDEFYDKLATQVRHGLFDFTGPLLAAEREAGLKIVLVSHSPQPLVEVFAQAIGGVDLAIGTEIPQDNGRFTGEPINVFRKIDIIGQLAARGYAEQPTVCLGDTEHDLGMLQLAERPLAIGIDPLGEDGGLHPLIHKRGLDIPIAGQSLVERELEICEANLGQGGYGCGLRAISIDELLGRLSLI